MPKHLNSFTITLKEHDSVRPHAVYMVNAEGRKEFSHYYMGEETRLYYYVTYNERDYRGGYCKQGRNMSYIANSYALPKGGLHFHTAQEIEDMFYQCA